MHSRSCADRISCALKTLLIETVRLAEAEAGRDCISAVCPETCLPELSKRSLSAVHPDLQREIADVVLAPSINCCKSIGYFVVGVVVSTYGEESKEEAG